MMSETQGGGGGQRGPGKLESEGGGGQQTDLKRATNLLLLLRTVLNRWMLCGISVCKITTFKYSGCFLQCEACSIGIPERTISSCSAAISELVI